MSPSKHALPRLALAQSECSWRTHATSYVEFPVIPGYETVGRIIATGSNVPHEMLDKMVYVGGARCYEGVNPAWGGQASHLHADYTRVVTLDGMAPTHGVLLALAATALHGVDIAGDITGKRVLILRSRHLSDRLPHASL
jgi:3-hydroxyethyl bacteriochlorophyllide a dehydrogenase